MADPEVRLLFRLALAFGRPVGWLLDNLSSAEWSLWLAFAAAEPFGPRRDDYRAGVVGSSVLAAWGATVTPADLFPSLADPADRAADSRAAFAGLCPALTPINR